MAFTTQDRLTLQTRSFLKDYGNNNSQFIEVGKIVYQTLLTYGGTAPVASDVERPLAIALQSTTLFKTLCAAKPHANPKFYPAFAEALARYMLYDAWHVIRTP